MEGRNHRAKTLGDPMSNLGNYPNVEAERRDRLDPPPTYGDPEDKAPPVQFQKIFVTVYSWCAKCSRATDHTFIDDEKSAVECKVCGDLRGFA